MITSIALDRSTATIDHTIIVDIVGDMPRIQRQWCFEAIDTCSFDWMRLAAASGLVTHDSLLGPAGATPTVIAMVCQLSAKEGIPRFDQGEYGYGVWGNPRAPSIAAIIWDGLGTAPPPFGGRVFFKETVIHAFGHVVAEALGVQKDPWKMVEIGTALKLGNISTETFDSPATPPDLLLPPGHRPTQQQIKDATRPQISDIYNAWFGIGRHIKQMHRPDFFVQDPDLPPGGTQSFYYLYWGKTIGVDGVPGMYNPAVGPEIVGGGVIMQEHYVTVDATDWAHDPWEFMAEAFKDIYAGEGSYRFTNRTKLKADYHLIDQHFSVRLPIGTTGYAGGSSDDINSALIPPGGFGPDFSLDMSFRTGLPTSTITQHSSISVRPWIPRWRAGSHPNEARGSEFGAYLYATTVTENIEQQTEVQRHHGGNYEHGNTFTIKLDEPPAGVALEDWLVGAGTGTLGSQISVQVLVDIARNPAAADAPFDTASARAGGGVLTTPLFMGNTFDGTTQVQPFLAGLPVIGRGGWEFPISFIVEWHAESRRGPGRLTLGVINVLGLDNGGHPVTDRIMGRESASDDLINTELDTGGTGLPPFPLTVLGQ